MKNKLFHKAITKLKNSRGFTVVELLIIMGLASILIGVVTINLLKVQHNTSVSTAVNTLVADMKGQQIKAMNGTTTGGNPDSYGISFETSKYVLFHGLTYNSADSTNFPVTFESSINVSSTTFPGNVVIFSQKSGEICSSSCTNTITVKNIAGTEQAVITINRYGVIKSIQ